MSKYDLDMLIAGLEVGKASRVLNAFPGIVSELKEYREFLFRGANPTTNGPERLAFLEALTDELQGTLARTKSRLEALLEKAWYENKKVIGIIKRLSLGRVKARADLREAEEIMREVEWALGGFCRWCGRHESEGHAPDCRLKAWLERRG